MPADHQIDIALLRPMEASELAPLLAAYAQALNRGEPRQPDALYTSALLRDRAAEVIGARIDGKLVGFAVFSDLPDPITGLRTGQVDHLYVDHDHRSKRIAKALLDLIADQAEDRGWGRLVLNAPRQPEDGRRLYEQVAIAADWTSYVIHFEGK